MNIWIDAQFSPHIALWIRTEMGIEATALRDLNLRDATDLEIFMAARQNSAVVMTKDSDFIRLLDLYGSPPSVLWITCGNTSNAQLRSLLTQTLHSALLLLDSGEKLVEIRDIR
jgi:predicted nuclease of predicted toxin-antitoxin system